MRVVPPLAILDNMLVSSTAPEPGVGEAAWSGSTTYNTGDKAIEAAVTGPVTLTIASPGVVNAVNHGLGDGIPVYFTTSGALPTGITAGILYYVVNAQANTFNIAQVPDGIPVVFSGSQSGTQTIHVHLHRVYESLQDGNALISPMNSPTWWQEDGPTNRWAMFDLLRNTATQVASPLTVVLAPGQVVDSIALLGLVADSVSITATSVTGGGTVYTYSAALTQRQTSAWSGYSFGIFTAAQSVVRFDLPAYADLQITVTLTRSGGYVACGALVMGNNVYVGRTLHQAENDALNFSTIDRDTFGNSILTPRRTVPKVNCQARVAKSNVPTLVDLRTMLNAVPAVWAGLDVDDAGYFGALLTLGVYKRFTITADMPDEALVALELEEV